MAPIQRQVSLLASVLLIAVFLLWQAPGPPEPPVRVEVEAAEAVPLPSPGPTRLDVQGHRGARALEPENTLIGFDRALRLGVSTLELDVGVTADGAVVVAHDPFIHPQRCLAPEGREIEGEQGPLLIDLSLEQVQAFDCGSLNPEPARFPAPPREDRPGERIPTLTEVFDLVRQRSNDRVGFNVEIKSVPGSDRTLPLEDFVATVIDVVRKYDFVDRTTIQAFDWRALVIAHEIDPRLELAALLAPDTIGPEWQAGIERLPEESMADWVRRVEPSIDVLSPDYRMLLGAQPAIEVAHLAGMRVLPWTVNDLATMERLIDMGVDGIITDRPDLLVELCRRRGIEIVR